MNDTDRSDRTAFRVRDVRFGDILDMDHAESPEGETTAVVGPSGGGKTTFLKMLNRILSPDQGRIDYLGRPLEEYEPVELRRRVVMLAQTPVVFPGTIRDNLAAGCRFAEREDPGNEEMEKALAEVELAKGVNEEVGTLSGGEKQRLTLARVMLMDPETLLLDEPSASLDAGTERLIFGSVTRYARQTGKTLVMVTHSEAEFSGYADRIIRLVKGKVDGGDESDG